MSRFFSASSVSSFRLTSGSPVRSSRPGALGGANFSWYDRPEAGCTSRPQMRSTRISSGTLNSITESILPAPSDTSISSSFSACGTVRGKPSRIKPLLHSGAPMLSLMMPITISSETSPPASITAFAFCPISVPAATAARSRSPVARWHRAYFSLITGACVPLPQPGGPTRMMFFLGGVSSRRLISASKSTVAMLFSASMEVGR
mmetsp:Transcript_22516/g.51881  ORF Transcript_22516/g.51881 Transcript_22516/m.51881 type:complete len:204 (+) Transcript_22516:678-1289(+)